MSADNGVYILRTLGEKEGEYEYRVAELMAVENVMWDDEKTVSILLRKEGVHDEDIMIKNAREMWNNCTVYYNSAEAWDAARRLYNDIVNHWVCEYGVSEIRVDRRF